MALFAVNEGDVAWPSDPVVTIAGPANVALAPEAGAVNVTVTPDTGLPPASFTTATSGLPKGVLTFALCPLPLTTVMLAADPAVLVKENEAGVAMFAAVALTAYVPAEPFAVGSGEVAWPSGPVVTTVGPVNVALAPEPGAANVTLTPDTGFPPESFTTATSGAANAVLIFAL